MHSFYRYLTTTDFNEPLDMVCVSSSSGLQHRDIGTRCRKRFADSMVQISRSNQNLRCWTPPSATGVLHGCMYSPVCETLSRKSLILGDVSDHRDIGIRSHRRSPTTLLALPCWSISRSHAQRRGKVAQSDRCCFDHTKYGIWGAFWRVYASRAASHDRHNSQRHKACD